MWNRRDAEKAKDEKTGEELIGLEIKIGWGKSLPRPPVPFYVHSPEDHPADAAYGGAPRDMRVAFPRDQDLKRLIDRMADFVSREGPDFERCVIQRESENPDFDFLWEPKSKEGIYYKWKVYSLCQSDTEYEWRRSSFQMFVGGLTWHPPVDDGPNESHNSQAGKQQSGRDRDKDRSRDKSRSRSRSRSPRRRSKSKREALTDRELDEFEDMLRLLTSERGSIGDAMVFCLGKAECAKEIVDTITEALCIAETPIPTKIARLHLVSDILHNTSANISKASLFRSFFESSMPEIFISLGNKLRGTEGRITAEAMKDKVTRVLRVWEVWSLYPPDFIAKLEATFLGKDPTTVGRAPSEEDADSVDGVPLDGDELDGEFACPNMHTRTPPQKNFPAAFGSGVLCLTVSSFFRLFAQASRWRTTTLMGCPWTTTSWQARRGAARKRATTTTRTSTTPRCPSPSGIIPRAGWRGADETRV